jgi:hypothetical protein
MVTPDQLEALEAGIHFMPWLASDHSLYDRKPDRFFASLGMSWDEVVNQCKDSDEAIAAFVESFSRNLPPEAAHVFHWFELGRRTIFIAGLAGTGAPLQLHHQAVAEYHSLLENAGIDVSEREEVEALVLDVTDGSLEAKEAKLQRICARLRHHASIMSPSRPDPVLWNTRWASGILYLFAAIVIASLLLAALQVLPPLASALVIAGSVLGVGIIGASQLQNDERLGEESYFKLMALSYAYLPFIRRGSESNDGETP